MNRKNFALPDGAKVAGFEVLCTLKVWVERTRTKAIYRVRCLRCSNEQDMTHSYLLSKRRRSPKGCAKCQRGAPKPVPPTPEERAPEPEIHYPKPTALGEPENWVCGTGFIRHR